jgi:opacity protein-like surface antigen
MSKMRTFAIISLLSISCFLPVNVKADGHHRPYFGLQIASTSYQKEGLREVEPVALVARFGIRNEIFGYEGRGGIGINKGDSSIEGKDLEVSIDSLLGAYITAQKQFDSVSIYGLVGFTYIIATQTISGGQGPPFTHSSSQDDEFGLSFGFGVNFGQIADIEFNIEYMSYLDDDEISIDAVSLGVVF